MVYSYLSTATIVNKIAILCTRERKLLENAALAFGGRNLKVKLDD